MGLWQISLYSLLILVVVVVGVSSENPPTGVSVNINSLKYDKVRTLRAAVNHATHMEFDLYRNDGSILFSRFTELVTTNARGTVIVASGFSYISSFKQLNSSHIAVVDRQRHCVKIINREDNSNRVLAGVCGTSGFVDGASAKFRKPWGIELDEKNPGQLLITDGYNNALRTVDVASGTVSTVIGTGFDSPKGFTWYNGGLLVCNTNYISRVSWSSNGAITNKKLTTSAVDGYQDGDFSVAQFKFPVGIKELRDGLFLVADYYNEKLRLLNMHTKKVLPVCVGSTTRCTTGTSLSTKPLSVLISENAVYVGGRNKILKLTDPCPDRDKMLYISPRQQTAQLTLPNGGFAKLAAGDYEFGWPQGSTVCHFYVEVKEL